jgi:ADP-ribosylglycohydrolase
MALCLANSLVARRDYVPYDQLVRYKWWYQEGYMSSTGSCFDIGAATRHSIQEFERRQKIFAEEYGIPFEQLDFLSDPELLGKFNVNCSQEGVAGNGALMRLAPVPLFFYRDPIYAVKCSGHSGEITHGDEKAYDACRYYGALIVAAVNGASKEDLLDDEFYVKHENWFDGKPLHQDIEAIARGSYKKGGYAKGIRGKGYIVNALEAALWAFWSENDSFDKGALAAVNLGDDTDTTAAIYGQLAGAYYGYENLRKDWVDEVYAKKFIKYLSKWIAYEGERWFQKRQASLSISTMTVESPYEQETNASAGPKRTENQRRGSKSSNQNQTVQMESISMSEQSGDPKSTFRPRRHTIHDKAFNLQPNSYRQHASDRPNSAENQKPPSERQRKDFHFLIRLHQ